MDCLHSNSYCVAQTSNCASLCLGSGVEERIDCGIQAGLGDFSLGLGWIWTEICAPSCTLVTVWQAVGNLSSALLNVRDRRFA